jgi:hypothetical protein
MSELELKVYNAADREHAWECPNCNTYEWCETLSCPNCGEPSPYKSEHCPGCFDDAKCHEYMARTHR